MNAPQLANCKRCKQLFQRHRQDKCPACVAEEQEKIGAVFKILTKCNPKEGIAASELATAAKVDPDELNELLQNGQLGILLNLIKYSCKSCGELADPTQLRGRFCVNCTFEHAAQAGVEVKSLRDIEDAEKAQQALKTFMPKQSKPAPTDTNNRRYGLRGGH